MIKRILAMLVLFALPIFAVDQKLGYVYTDQILKGYQGMSEPTADLNKEKTAFRQSADSIYQALTKAKSDFDAQKLLLSEEGKAAKNAEIEEIQRQYDTTVSSIYGPGGKLEQKTQEIMGPITQKIKDAVQKVAQDEGYTIVFDAAESKMAILYSAADADITKEVLDELNREFKPVSASGVGTRRYAVCPIYEANDEAQKDNDGEQVRSVVYNIVNALSQVQVVAPTDLNSALLNLGGSGQANITDDLAYRLGMELQTDYIFYGSVTKSDQKFSITLNVADPRLKKTFQPQSATANRQEDLKTVITNMVGKLVGELPQQ
jgi:outer membrane protein